jgi:hypothetical protein
MTVTAHVIQSHINSVNSPVAVSSMNFAHLSGINFQNYYFYFMYFLMEFLTFQNGDAVPVGKS